MVHCGLEAHSLRGLPGGLDLGTTKLLSGPERIDFAVRVRAAGSWVDAVMRCVLEVKVRTLRLSSDFFFMSEGFV